MIASADSKPATKRAGRFATALTCLATTALLAAPLAQAQDWGDDSEDDWNAPPPEETRAPAASTPTPARSPGETGWSFRTGIGFTADPDTFLLNLEAPYALEPWIALGPMLQLGLEKDDKLVMPTLNVTLKVPDMPGQSFDRVHPYGFFGIGMAYVEREVRGDDRDGVGFLVTTGIGVEYQVSTRVFFGSQMMFNILPSKTQGETFIFAWQMGGIRFAF